MWYLRATFVPWLISRRRDLSLALTWSPLFASVRWELSVAVVQRSLSSPSLSSCAALGLCAQRLSAVARQGFGVADVAWGKHVFSLIERSVVRTVHIC
jgi:hypothetical protein